MRSHLLRKFSSKITNICNTRTRQLTALWARPLRCGPLPWIGAGGAQRCPRGMCRSAIWARPDMALDAVMSDLLRLCIGILIGSRLVCDRHARESALVTLRLKTRHGLAHVPMRGDYRRCSGPRTGNARRMKAGGSACTDTEIRGAGDSRVGVVHSPRLGHAANRAPRGARIDRRDRARRRSPCAARPDRPGAAGS